MRILHISTRLILGGSQENTVLSCEGQARLGHKVHLAYGPIYGPEGSLLERIEEFNRRCDSGGELVRPVGRHVPVRSAGERVVPIVVHEVPHLVREISPIADWRCLGELKKLIARIGPEIVHTHSSKAGIIGRAAGWSLQSGVGGGGNASVIGVQPPGVIHTIHGPPFMPIEGGVLKRTSTQVKNWIYTVAERFAARRCHVIVSVADAMTELFLEKGIGSEGQYITVYSGMEIEEFLEAAPGEDQRAGSRASLGLKDDDVVIGTVARLAEHKGHDDLLSAMGERMKEDPRCKLLWVGDGWWRNRLIDHAQRLGLKVRQIDRAKISAGNDGRWSDTSDGAQVILTGLVPPERVPGLIRAMDILAHPSYREGLPRTVPQALLCGVTPVAYDVDGTGEICRDEVTGKLVPAGDVVQLRAAIVRLMTHPEDRVRMAVLGRDECADRFSAERMVAELEGVYARALAAARGQQRGAGGGGGDAR